MDVATQTNRFASRWVRKSCGDHACFMVPSDIQGGDFAPVTFIELYETVCKYNASLEDVAVCLKLTDADADEIWEVITWMAEEEGIRPGDIMFRHFLQVTGSTYEGPEE